MHGQAEACKIREADLVDTQEVGHSRPAVGGSLLAVDSLPVVSTLLQHHWQVSLGNQPTRWATLWSQGAHQQHVRRWDFIE